MTRNAPIPCDDVIGHGSAVAGLAIYEGEIESVAKSRIVAVKLTGSMEFPTSALKGIEFVVRKFKRSTRVFNLSFSSGGPDPSISKAIDDLAYREDVLFVVSAGNIERPVIIEELNNGESYPGYLGKHYIYCPGDCFNVLTVGSYAGKASNMAMRDYPSPFTRSRTPAMSVLKPELLASGGNLNEIRLDGQVVNLDFTGVGVRSTSNNDNEFIDGVGTSLSAPIVSSIAAGLVQKFPEKRACFYKALIISSAERLVDGQGVEFDPYLQGFGVPNRAFALVSPYSRTNLVADSSFDLVDQTIGHKYTFYFPQSADSIRVTVCFDVEPLLKAQELPYEIDVRLRKAATRTTTYARPDKVIPGGASNSKIYEFDVQRAGIGDWTVEVFPKVTGVLRRGRLSGKRLHYCLVVTIYSSKGRAVYNQVKSQTRLVPSGLARQVDAS